MFSQSFLTMGTRLTAALEGCWGFQMPRCLEILLSFQIESFGDVDVTLHASMHIYTSLAHSLPARRVVIKKWQILGENPLFFLQKHICLRKNAHKAINEADLSNAVLL